MKPVGVGFVGAGNVLSAYLQLLDRLVPRGLAVEGPICARRRTTWESIRARRPRAVLVADPREVVDSDVHVVVVITPPDSHAELARLALEHGKHVVVEKPLAPSRREAEELFRIAAERGLHVLAAPFVQLAPTLRELWTLVRDGAIGRVHSARALYGNAGSHWARWYHTGGIGPLPEVGVYNVKSLIHLLGAVTEVAAAETTAVAPREVGSEVVDDPDPDVVHVLLRHEAGALSSVVASQAIQRYRRPAIELYGTEGTANLLGDDWDPRGLELWRNEESRWNEYEPIEPTWLWADGLRELVAALREDRPPLTDASVDLHVLDVLEAAHQAAVERSTVPVESRPADLDLRLGETRSGVGLHDHTRPSDEQ
jgi:predicted dehydrogenase